MRLPRSVPAVTRLLVATACSAVVAGACGSSTKSAGPTTVTPTTAAGQPPTIHPRIFAAAPAGASKPDDITELDGMLYVTYQNNAGKDGTPAGSMSTIAVFDPATGKVATTYSVVGRCDGLTADPTNHRVLASVNEDANSSLFVITPGTPDPAHYTYTPDPAETGSDGPNGGTDAISVAPDGTIYIAHSNPDAMLPAPNNTAAVFTLTLSGTTANLKRVYGVNDPATVVNQAAAPAPAPLGLTDPDSNRFVADLAGGTLIQDAQGDSKLVLSGPHPGDPIRQLNLTNAAPTQSGKEATPQLDDIEEVRGAGVLYAVDQLGGNVFAIDVTAAERGLFFVSQPVPSSTDKPNNAALGVVDMKTGVVTHIDTTLGSPKGLLFVPAK